MLQINFKRGITEKMKSLRKIILSYSYDNISRLKRIIVEIERKVFEEETYIGIVSEKYTEKVEVEIYISYNIYDILKKRIEIENIINNGDNIILFEETLEERYVKLV